MKNIVSTLSLLNSLVALGLLAGLAQAATCQNNLGASNPNVVYLDHSDSTVTDTRTGLTWKRCAEGLSGVGCSDGSALMFVWSEALSHAESSGFAGYTDWRLPNIKELTSLVEECRTEPAINNKFFPNTPGWYFWSGSPSTYRNSRVVGFGHGDVTSGGRGDSYHVRLVRGGR